jgi:hypothetical protein
VYAGQWSQYIESLHRNETWARSHFKSVWSGLRQVLPPTIRNNIARRNFTHLSKTFLTSSICSFVVKVEIGSLEGTGFETKS